MTAFALVVLLVGGWGRSIWQAGTLFSQSAKIVRASNASVMDSVSTGAAWSWAISSAVGAVYSASIHAWPILAANMFSTIMQAVVLVRVYLARQVGDGSRLETQEPGTLRHGNC